MQPNSIKRQAFFLVSKKTQTTVAMQFENGVYSPFESVRSESMSRWSS